MTTSQKSLHSPASPASRYQASRAALSQASVFLQPFLPFRPDLRHHLAGVLLSAGESVVAVAERLGHEDASLVLSTYGHLMPDSDDRTRSAIDAAWTAGRESCAPGVPQGAQALR